MGRLLVDAVILWSCRKKDGVSGKYASWREPAGRHRRRQAAVDVELEYPWDGMLSGHR